MIIIFTSEYRHYGTFRTFADVVNHIAGIEKMKLGEGPIQSGLTDWHFKYYDFTQVCSLYEGMKESPDREKLKEAYDRRLAVLEICSGQYQNPVFVPVTNDLDIEGLRKSWCFDYYQRQAHLIIETFDIAGFEEEVAGSLSFCLPFLEWLPDRNNFTKAYPYGLYIRAPYPLTNKSIAPVVNEWRNCLMAGEVV